MMPFSLENPTMLYKTEFKTQT